jgi:hypothetical protein
MSLIRQTDAPQKSLVLSIRSKEIENRIGLHVSQKKVAVRICLLQPAKTLRMVSEPGLDPKFERQPGADLIWSSNGKGNCWDGNTTLMVSPAQLPACQ